MTDAPLLCPSAQPDQPDAAVFGVQTRTASGERQVAYIPQAMPVTPELLALSGPARPAEVLRIAAPCMKSGCQHYGGGACSLAARIATMLDPVVSGLPRCAIRPTCRWFREQGRAACLRCPQVVTDARPDSGLPPEVAGPGAASPGAASPGGRVTGGRVTGGRDRPMTAVALFRAEALEHHRRGDHAGVPLPAPPPPAVLAWALLACVLLGLAVAAGGSYARKQRVAGYLAPRSGVARIVAPRGGLIVAVQVRDGDVVAAGAALLTVQSGGADAAGQDVDGAVLAALERQRARLVEQADIEQANLARERARLADHLETLAQEQAALQVQLRLQTQRTSLSRQQEQAAQSLLAGGNISRIELQHRQDAVLAQLQAAAGLARDLAAKRAQIEQDSHALLALPDAAAARIAALRAQLADIDTRVAETSGRQAILLRAPIAGRVTALQAAVGQAANPAIPLLAIIPSGEALRAELLVPARAIGEIRPGQAVRIAFDAFPPARFGLARGEVQAVSRSLLRPSELAGPLSAAEPCYRVSVALDAQSVGAGDAARPLLPDLTVTAAIVIDRHSLLGWLLMPLRERIEPRT